MSTAALEPRRRQVDLGASARLALGLMWRTSAKWAFSGFSTPAVSPPWKALVTKAPPGFEDLDGEVGGRLDQADDAQVVGLAVAGGVGGHVGQHEVRRPADQRRSAGSRNRDR